MRKKCKLLSFCLLIVLSITLLSGCAENSLLAQKLGKHNPGENQGAVANPNLKDDKKNEKDAEYYENIRTELLNIVTQADAARLNELSNEELEVIYKKKNNLLSNLRTELNYNKVRATVDSANGTVSFKPSAFYHSEGNVLASEGEKLLSTFLPIYTFIIYNNKYEDFVTSVTLDYYAGAEESLSLAQRRLNTIHDFAVTTYKSGIATNYDGKFKNMLQCKAHAYDNENTEGSVVFKIYIQLN